MSSMVPITRSLPYVLREQLEQSQQTTVMIGRVTAVPDRAHVTVDLAGSTITIPKLMSYGSPVVGEPVFVLSDPLYTIALGSVSATPPAPITDAGTLDGIDSTGFFRLAVADSRLFWFGTFTGIALVSGACTVNHALGRVPSFGIAGRLSAPSQTVTGALIITAWSATTVSLQYAGLATSGSGDFSLLLAG